MSDTDRTGSRVEPARDMVENEDYRSRIMRRRMESVTRIVVIIVVLVLAALLIRTIVDRKKYNGYRFVKTSTNEDTLSTNYKEMDGMILRYSLESASLVTDKLEILWTYTYDMSKPIAEICDSTAVIADQGGTVMSVFDNNGLVGTITTPYNIVKAEVARQGVVAAILDDGEDTWINFYTPKGDLIAENQTRVDDPGYPMDLAVSPDGKVIMVAYEFVQGSNVVSYIAFYNFGTAGQNQIDNIVSGYTYDGAITPEVCYLSEECAVAFRDNGFSIYEGKQIPKEIKSVTVESEVISTFYDESHIGLVFHDDAAEEKMYRMEVYNRKGRKLYERTFNIQYTNIEMSDGYILMRNSNQVGVMNANGREKYNGDIVEGTVRDFFKIGWNKYILVLENGVNVMKLR